ncbi:MAG: DUF2059 domain-containing protein [Zoogloeaceae bacterium]|jgi:hypothetical protein|nr:DUF2059 domain-containing protein [Zoogloeaceae bacterium]
MKFLFFVIALAISAQVNADESARQAKISEIVEAQGLLQTFQQQIDQAKLQAGDIGEDLYRTLLRESGMSDEQENPKLKQVLTQYLERCSKIFTAEELTEIWSRFYGSDLSEAELDEILAFYKSPIGKKDVAASQAALVSFSQILNTESQNRMDDAIGQLMADIKAAIGCDSDGTELVVAPCKKAK